MGDELQNLNDADQLADLIRIDPEVWFSTFAVIKDKRGKDIKPKANTLQKRMFAHYRKCQIEGLPCKMACEAQPCKARVDKHMLYLIRPKSYFCTCLILGW